MNSFQLFVQQAQLASEDIKKRCVETVFDLLMVYESDFFKEVRRSFHRRPRYSEYLTAAKPREPN